MSQPQIHNLQADFGLARQATVTILSIEDSIEDQVVLEKLLRQGRDVDLRLIHTTSVDAAREILLERVADVVVLDYHQWDGAALDVMHTLDERGELERVPVLILTSEGNEPNALEALRLGAQRYLLKDRLTAQTLWTAIDLSRERLAVSQALHRSRAELEERVAQRTEALQRSVDELNGFTYSISLSSRIARARSRSESRPRRGHRNQPGGRRPPDRSVRNPTLEGSQT